MKGRQLTKGRKDFSGGYAGWLEAVRRKVALDGKLAGQRAPGKPDQQRRIKSMVEDADKAKPTPERLHMDGMSNKDWDREKVRKDRVQEPMRLSESPLEMLKTRRKIEKVQHDAGELLFDHWYNSNLNQEGAIDYTKPMVDGGGAGLEPSERRVHHAKQYAAAMATLTDVTERGVVYSVVIRQNAVDVAGAETDYSNKRDRRTAGMVLLRTGLNRLAEHFGLFPPEEIRRRRHAFMATGGRPGIVETAWEHGQEPSAKTAET